MPELPEIETIRLQISKIIIGKRIETISIEKKKSFIGDPSLTYNSKIKNIRRFAKILVIDFSNNISLAVHLKMSGQLLFRSENIEVRIKNGKLNNLPDKHTRVIITFTDGDKLFFNDMRNCFDKRRQRLFWKEPSDIHYLDSLFGNIKSVMKITNISYCISVKINSVGNNRGAFVFFCQMVQNLVSKFCRINN